MEVADVHGHIPTSKADIVTLPAVLGNHSITEPIKNGAVPIPRVRLDLHEYSPTYSAFPAMVNEQRFDLCEMALATAFLAYRFKKPISLLPVAVLGRFQHPYLVYRTSSGVHDPADLKGRTVAVRSYTVTTGVWVRGILEEMHGVHPGEIRWLTFEAPHVSEFSNPPNVEVAPSGTTPMSALISGLADAAVIGEDTTLPEGVERLFPASATDDWYARHAVVPINHVLSVSNTLCGRSPDVVRSIFDAFRQAKAKVSSEALTKFDPNPVGLSACRPAIEMLIDFAVSQGILDRRPDVEDLIAEPIRH